MISEQKEILASLDRRYATLWREAQGVEPKSRLASEIIARLYDDFYHVHLSIPEEAKLAFETCNWTRSLELSRLRINAFGDYRDIALKWFRSHAKTPEPQEGLWESIYRLHLQKIAGSYQGDIAYAFLSSIRRGLTKDRWRIVDYSYARATGARRPALSERPNVEIDLEFSEYPTAKLVDRILAIPKFRASYRDRLKDSELVSQKIKEVIPRSTEFGGRIRIVDGGFYRNRGCYIVGTIDTAVVSLPFSLALLNGEQGIYVDAVIFESDRLHYIFSSSLANFHSTNGNFHEIVDVLYEMMPKRPRGLHYATIGYNHVGKLAVLRQIEKDIVGVTGALNYAPGPRGSVAIGFTSEKLGYVLKIVRDRPTDQYKWGAFPGISSVLEKYRKVHEINRAGSMLDNVIYENVALPYNAFDSALREELLSAAGENVACQDGMLIFRHLIVQMKMTPLPQFLKEASLDDALEAISSLGRCIKNNAAANIFNKDLDGRNYGVGPTLRVYLFDYDAVETLTEVKVRTNVDRFDGEEDVPEWFFEDGFVFLPEEIESHLRLEDRRWRQAFRSEHGELTTLDYWLQRQQELSAGLVPRVSTYPNECRLVSAA